MWSSVRLADIQKRVPDYGTEALMKLYRAPGLSFPSLLRGRG